MKFTPQYRWVCHKCGTVNEPDVGKCTACGLDAVARAKEFMTADAPSEDSGNYFASPETAKLLMFFPEIIAAAVIVVFSPFWILSLLVNGRFWPALGLAVGIGSFTYTFFACAREKQTFLAYVSMVGVLLIAILAASSK